MITLPALSAVTRPVADTVATEGLNDAHATAKPASGVLAASRGVAANCIVAPDTIEKPGPVTVTAATCGACALTVTCTEPVRPPAVADIVEVPAPAAVITPIADTVATAGLDD